MIKAVQRAARFVYIDDQNEIIRKSKRAYQYGHVLPAHKSNSGKDRWSLTNSPKAEFADLGAITYPIEWNV